MIRKMVETDLTQVVDLENILFSKRWVGISNSFAMNYWKIRSQTYWYLKRIKRLLDILTGGLLMNKHSLPILQYVLQIENKVVGQQLLNEALQKAIEEECENMTLEVRVSNERAIQFYEKNGFITVNTRKNYYEDGENAYLMIKPLGGL